MLDELFAKKLILVTGKGGIGKSLVASALGQLSAERGLRTLLVESNHNDQLAPLFGYPAIGHNETEIAKNLTCINLNSTENFHEYVTKYLGYKGLFDKVFSNRVVQAFIKMIPGFSELMLLGRLFYTCELAKDKRYDLVVFDGFASGHFLSLMTTPEAIISTKLGGPLVKETLRVQHFLRDRSKCGTVYVTIPESLVVNECLEFLPKLRDESPASIDGLVVNRVLHPLGVKGGVNSVNDFVDKKIERQAKALEELEAGLAGLNISLPIAKVDDQGFVNIPLAADFGKEFLKTVT